MIDVCSERADSIRRNNSFVFFVGFHFGDVLFTGLSPEVAGGKYVLTKSFHCH